MDNAAILLARLLVHKTHVTRDNRSGDVVVAIEGEGEGHLPGRHAARLGHHRRRRHHHRPRRRSCRHLRRRWRPLCRSRLRHHRHPARRGQAACSPRPSRSPTGSTSAKTALPSPPMPAASATAAPRSRPSSIRPGGSFGSSPSTARSTAKASVELVGLAVSGRPDRPGPDEHRLHGARVLDQQDVAARRRRLGDLRDHPDGLPRHHDGGTRGPAAGLPCRAQLHAAWASSASRCAGSSTSCAGSTG